MTQETQLTKIDWNNKELANVIRQTCAATLNENEFELFKNIAISTGLNPFLKEIWGLKFGQTVMIMIGINGYFKFANNHPAYDGYEVEFEVDPLDSKKPLSCTAKIYRKDRTRPTISIVRFSEYYRPSSTNKGRWDTAPFDMLEKCALAKGLRRTLTELNGTYVEEELEKDKLGRIVEVKTETTEEQVDRIVGEYTQQTVKFCYATQAIPADKIDKLHKYLQANNAKEVQNGIWESDHRLALLDNYLIVNADELTKNEGGKNE